MRVSIFLGNTRRHRRRVRVPVRVKVSVRVRVRVRVGDEVWVRVIGLGLGLEIKKNRDPHNLIYLPRDMQPGSDDARRAALNLDLFLGLHLYIRRSDSKRYRHYRR